MALDAANFISELSITDPPGSDPLSQGDDQIRTCKRSVFNSFAFIDKAVLITADQMNEMAIKNEGNLFTVQQSITGDLVITKNINSDKFGVFYNDEVGFRRWALIYEPTTNGGPFILDRRDAAGVSIDRPWTVSLTTGIVDFAHVPTVAGAPLWIAGEVRQFVLGAAVPGTNWFYADGTDGTVDLRNRMMMGDGVAVAGTLQAPNLVGTAAASTVGSTAISAAQMPSHNHRVKQRGAGGGIADGSALTVCEGIGGVRNTAAGGAYVDAGTDGVFIEAAGSGGGHNHSQTAVAVTENGTDRDTVRPLSAVVRFFQYVP